MMIMINDWKADPERHYFLASVWTDSHCQFCGRPESEHSKNPRVSRTVVNSEPDTTTTTESCENYYRRR
jgi:hypothetical protein